MTNELFPNKTFSEDDIKRFEPSMKLGFLATVNDSGQPHLTMISTLSANTPTEVTWGQFAEGLSKKFIQKRPKAGFLIMTLDKNLWRGKAIYTHTAKSGKEYDMYNNQPLFRYNSYFGIHTVYYMDLVSHSGRQPLPMNSVVMASIATLIARSLGRGGKSKPILNHWSRGFLNMLSNLKFLSYVDQDGFPVIIPVIQAQALNARQVIFSTSVYGGELKAIPAGTSVALHAMSFAMEDLLVRGQFTGIRRAAGFPCGIIDVDWVYNPMPPAPQQIYPETRLETVTNF